MISPDGKAQKECGEDSAQQSSFAECQKYRANQRRHISNGNCFGIMSGCNDDEIIRCK